MLYKLKKLCPHWWKEEHLALTKHWDEGVRPIEYIYATRLRCEANNYVRTCKICGKTQFSDFNIWYNWLDKPKKLNTMVEKEIIR